MTKQIAEKSTRTDLFKVPVENVRVEDGFNIREDMGDLESLAQSIKENGVRVALRGYRNDGLFYIINGHRRYQACKLLAERGIHVLMPFALEERGTNPEQRVFDMFICNDGKELNPLEQANGIQRAINYGYSVNDIAKKIGKTPVYVGNLKMLANAPEKIKNHIRSEKITGSLVVKILRSEKNFETACELIENAIAGEKDLFTQEEAPSKPKITEKDINKAKGKLNSFAELKKALRYAEKNELEFKDEKKELVEFALKIVEGKLDVKKFVSLLFNAK